MTIEKNILAYSRMLDEVFIQHLQCIKMSISIDEADLRPCGQTCNQDRTLDRKMTEEKETNALMHPRVN